MITGLTSYKTYFKTIADTLIVLAGSFFIGNSERIISAARSTLTYPCLWLEYPTISGVTDSMVKMRGAFVILTNKQVDDWPGQDTILQTNLNIALQIIAKMKKDTQENNQYFNIPGIHLDPITWSMIDNDWGWRVEFDFDIPLGMCYDESEWNIEEEG